MAIRRVKTSGNVTEVLERGSITPPSEYIRDIIKKDIPANSTNTVLFKGNIPVGQYHSLFLNVTILDTTSNGSTVAAMAGSLYNNAGTIDGDLGIIGAATIDQGTGDFSTNLITVTKTGNTYTLDADSSSTDNLVYIVDFTVISTARSL